MFWKKQRSEPEPQPSEKPSPTPAAPAAPDVAEEAIDALGAILRALGRHAFDLGEVNAKTVEKTLEGWAAHVLVFAPPPGQEAAKGTVPRRNFGALVRAITEHRKAEREYVQSAIPELRGMVWSFVNTLARSLGADETADARLRERVKRLEVAAAGESFAALKAEANATASAIAEVVQQREERARRQATELAQALGSLKEQLEEATREGALDPLTRIYNRKTLEEVLQRSAHLSTLALEPCTLMMIDIDHFKQINDRYGHPAGDAVLKGVADALVRCFPRRADVVARYGGEEFSVVLNGSSIREAVSLAERPLAAMRGLAVKHGPHTIQVTVSIGFAVVHRGESVASWVERADKALYAAKQGGRNRAVGAPDDAQPSGERAPSSSSQPPFVKSSPPAGRASSERPR
jgi:diguanylate cyclase